ncbi:hypothetical protein MHU86_21131 [Fragilaria crotonensis]|nr:hypothetical protein MHU86_21131 [Fragilaria crotonensis]
MVEKQRPRSGSKFSLKPQIAAALSALPPLGYKAPPSLIGGKHTSHDVLALRARNYAKAYKTLSVKDWNSYVVFGIQQFASPSKYLAIRDSESKHACHLRIGRYYRLHLEHKAPVDKFLMSQIVGIEAALHTTFPGYFDMSVVEMDEYLQTLSPDDIKNTDAAIEVDSPNEKATPHQDDTPMIDSVRGDKLPATLQESTMCPTTSPTPTYVSSPLSQVMMKEGSGTTTTTPTTQEFQEILRSIPLLEPDSPGIDTNYKPRPKSGKKQPPSQQAMAPEHKGPEKITDPLRIEARWAPKDFHALKASTAQMYIRLAPLLSTFNTAHSWVIEWQTDQLAPEQIISPAQLSKFLGIRMVTVSAQQCFYFSFRVNATGKQLVHVLQSKEHKKAKRGKI